MVQKTNRAQRIGQTQIIRCLENLYISPLEACNLACKFCYTRKTRDILSHQQILDFINQYSGFIYKKYFLSFKSVLFCGGEVFLLSDFSQLVNTLIDKDIFITIITNGTIDRLQEIKKPNSCQILVSLDGPKNIHDQNRGPGNFNKSVKYIKHAQKLGFPVAIMFLVTQNSYPYKDSFSEILKTKYDIQNIPLIYLTDRKMSLTHNQCLDIKLRYPTFPAKNFGCYQLSLQSNGNITGCCESSISLGKITDNPQIYISKFIKSLSKCFSCSIHQSHITNPKSFSFCGGCCDPGYLCGYLREFHQNSCQDIIKLLHKT